MDKIKVNKKLLLIVIIILFAITLYHLVHYILCKPEPFQQLSMVPPGDLMKIQIGNTIPLSQIAQSDDLKILSAKLDKTQSELQKILDELNQFQLKATAEYSNEVGGSYRITIEGDPGNQVVHYSVPSGLPGPTGNIGDQGVQGLSLIHI